MKDILRKCHKTVPTASGDGKLAQFEEAADGTLKEVEPLNLQEQINSYVVSSDPMGGTVPNVGSTDMDAHDINQRAKDFEALYNSLWRS